jgi:hypothetical protein
MRMVLVLVFVMMILVTLDALSFCMHCRHAWRPLQRGLVMDEGWYCSKFAGDGREVVDLVTGRRDVMLTPYLPCWVARSDEVMCGVNGTYFDKKLIMETDKSTNA